MILDDFVMLGKTVPEANGDGRVFVCSAGASLELGQLVRVYPLARKSCPPRWSMSRLPLERNPSDSRRESWKIRGNRCGTAHESINGVIETMARGVSQANKVDIIRRFAVASIAEANAARSSLAILRPLGVPLLALEQADTAQMMPTPDLFGDAPELPVLSRFEWHPRLRFCDEAGEHDLMLRDWGCYEWMRKGNPPLALAKSLLLNQVPYLLVGNLNRHRTSWLVISILGSRLAPACQQAVLFG